MASVTGRIKDIKQPKGGYIKPSEFETIAFKDGTIMNPVENIHGALIGMVTDYLTRFITGTELNDAFHISLMGAILAEKLGKKDASSISINLLKNIKGLDSNSIINACKLVTFDAWLRNPLGAALAKDYNDINPDQATIENIQTLVKRSITFFEKYGPITKDGFDFGPEKPDKELFSKMKMTKKGSYGGYTAIVDSGDGDFLTNDTLWDFKVIKSKPTSKHTLQLLMYWIMGKHSGQNIFKGITKIGIFNPRLNIVYLLDMSTVSEDIIKTVEQDVICYE